MSVPDRITIMIWMDITIVLWMQQKNLICRETGIESTFDSGLNS